CRVDFQQLSACFNVKNLSPAAGGADRGQKPAIGRKGEMETIEVIGRDIPQPFAGQSLIDTDALHISIANGDACGAGAEGEAAAAQLEIDRELCDGFASFEIRGVDGP